MQRDPHLSAIAPINAPKTLNRIGQGRHFLQIPGPTNVPDRVLRAIDFPTIDHRGPEFQRLGLKILEAIKPVFGTSNPVIIYPASGTGAWEAALVNTLNPGDTVLMAETGHFATLWKKLAKKLGIRGATRLQTRAPKHPRPHPVQRGRARSLCQSCVT